MSIFSKITARQIHERSSPRKPNVALGSLIMYLSFAFIFSQFTLNFIWFFFDWAIERNEPDISEPQLIKFVSSSIIIKWFVHLLIGLLYMLLAWFFLRGLPRDSPKRLWQTAFDEAKLSKKGSSEIAYYIGDIVSLIVIGFVLGLIVFLSFTLGAVLIGTGIAFSLTSNTEKIFNITGIFYFLIMPIFLIFTIRFVPPIEKLDEDEDENEEQDRSPSEGFSVLKRKDPVNWDDPEDQPISCKACGTMFNPSLKRCPLCSEPIKISVYEEEPIEEEEE